MSFGFPTWGKSDEFSASLTSTSLHLSQPIHAWIKLRGRYWSHRWKKKIANNLLEYIISNRQVNWSKRKLTRHLDISRPKKYPYVEKKKITYVRFPEKECIWMSFLDKIAATDKWRLLYYSDKPGNAVSRYILSTKSLSNDLLKEEIFSSFDHIFYVSLSAYTCIFYFLFYY